MKAVIKIGGKQYIVTENQTLLVDRLVDDTKTVDLEPLMVFDEKTATVGTPAVKGAAVKASVVEAEVKGDKIHIMKFKAKKRVKTLTGHRQKYTQIKIDSITTK
jgi:large subunit ribosomal protein L21